MKYSITSAHQVIMHSDQWLSLARMIFGVLDRQMNDGRRILTPTELQTLHKAGGAICRYMMLHPMAGFEKHSVTFFENERSVLLKVICWYEDALIKQMNCMDSAEELKLLSSYESITEITRAIQTAAPAFTD